MAKKIIDLGNGLELWEVAPSELKEQDVNARSMTTEMFNRLKSTIGRDKRLESLPLCALTERGMEVISGHHRLRAAIAAELPTMHVLMDVTGLTRDQIAAKQLAHNAIEGIDDNRLVSQIYNSIMDAQAKLEAFIDIPADQLPKVKIHDITLDLDYKQVLVMFLPAAKDRFDKIIEKIGKVDTVYVCDRERFEEFQKVANRLHKEYDIRSIGTQLAKMCDLVAAELGEDAIPTEGVAIRDLFKNAFVPKAVAERVTRALEELKKSGALPGNDLIQALDLWAAAELGEKTHAETVTAS